jgi:hypothetical protein
MFNGFPVTNTPAVQVWDFVRGASTAADRSVILTDDCAPIQFFKTGVASTINLYLPPSYPEGKTLTIINSPFLTTALSIAIYASDARNTTTGVSGSGDNIYRVRAGQTLQFFYTEQTLDQATSASSVTGWTCISQGSTNSSAPNGFATAGGTTFGNNAFAAGSGVTASASQSVAVGGTLNTASGTNAAAIGGSSNTASSTASAVIGGSSNNCSSLNSVIAGGSSNFISGANAAIVGGSGNSVYSDNCGVFGSTSSQAEGNTAVVVGGQLGTSRSVHGRFVAPASRFPISGSVGVSQASILIIGNSTTDATVTTLRSNFSAVSTTNQLVLPNNSAYYVRGSCIANVTGGGNTKAWSFEAAIKRGASAATTAIVGTVIKNIVAADAGAATWDITISADTTNGALAVSVTGQAATTIRWVCSLDSTEVTY